MSTKHLIQGVTMDDSPHRITLDFEDAETLHLALEYLGDPDAPVMITGGAVSTAGQTHRLWEDFAAAEQE